MRSLLKIAAKAIIIITPIVTGITTKSKPCSVSITMIGLAPAGGWIVSVNIIKKIAKATPRPNEI